MARRKPASRKKRTATAMVSEIRTTAEEFPEQAGKYALVRVPKEPAGEKRCVLWGRDPVTGKRVCLKWEPV